MVPTLALGPITAEIIAHGLVLLAGNLDHQLAVAAQQGQTCPEYVDILELIRGEKFGRSLLKRVGYDDAASVLPFKVRWESIMPPTPPVQTEPIFGSCPECGEDPVTIEGIALRDPPMAYCVHGHSWYPKGA